MLEKIGVLANAADASRSRTRSSCRFAQLPAQYLAKMNIYCGRMISNGVSCRPVSRRRRTCDEVQLWPRLPFGCVRPLLNHRPPAARSRTMIRNARSTQYSPIPMIAGMRGWHHDQLIPSKSSCAQAPRVRLASRTPDHECIIMCCGQVAANARDRRRKGGYGHAVRFIACDREERNWKQYPCGRQFRTSNCTPVSCSDPGRDPTSLSSQQNCKRRSRGGRFGEDAGSCCHWRKRWEGQVGHRKQSLLSCQLLDIKIEPMLTPLTPTRGTFCNARVKKPRLRSTPEMMRQWWCRPCYVRQRHLSACM